jgi:hypothetical protein
MAGARKLGESDWEDEDLLTHEEAGARLREEIESELAFIKAAGGQPSPAVRRAEARVAAMRRRVTHIDAALADGAGVVRRINRPIT